jgi:hypothetical protein
MEGCLKFKHELQVVMPSYTQVYNGMHNKAKQLKITSFITMYSLSPLVMHSGLFSTNAIPINTNNSIFMSLNISYTYYYIFSFVPLTSFFIFCTSRFPIHRTFQEPNPCNWLGFAVSSYLPLGLTYGLFIQVSKSTAHNHLSFPLHIIVLHIISCISLVGFALTKFSIILLD